MPAAASYFVFFALQFWLEREKLAVIISSTTGDGDPPDTAQKFVRRLKKKTLPRDHLVQLRYAFLGETLLFGPKVILLSP